VGKAGYTAVKKFAMAGMSVLDNRVEPWAAQCFKIVEVWRWPKIALIDHS